MLLLDLVIEMIAEDALEVFQPSFVKGMREDTLVGSGSPSDGGYACC